MTSPEKEKRVCRCRHSASYHRVPLVRGCVACDCKGFDAKETREARTP